MENDVKAKIQDLKKAIREQEDKLHDLIRSGSVAETAALGDTIMVMRTELYQTVQDLLRRMEMKVRETIKELQNNI